MDVHNRCTITLSPIGVVRRTGIAAPRDLAVQAGPPLAAVVLEPNLAPALDGIDGFSHIYVVYWLHEIDRAEAPLIHHAGRLADGQPVGIFATRAALRPNPLGLSLVELVRRESSTLWVRGLDALDGSPVLDVKPYPELADRRARAVTRFRVPEWVELTEDE